MKPYQVNIPKTSRLNSLCDPQRYQRSPARETPLRSPLKPQSITAPIAKERVISDLVKTMSKSSEKNSQL